MHVRLRVGGRFLPGRLERNVIADIGSGERHVLVGAHYDSVWHGPGAIDNASGVEGVRRSAEALKDTDARVRFVAFAAEEIKLTGSRYYVDEAKLRGELAQIGGDGVEVAGEHRLALLGQPAREQRIGRARVVEALAGVRGPAPVVLRGEQEVGAHAERQLDDVDRELGDRGRRRQRMGAAHELREQAVERALAAARAAGSLPNR